MNNLGKLAEIKAANFLRQKKYNLIDVNYTCRFGEIDLIFTYKKFIVFVEVKMRNENSIAQPREFVDEGKQRKMASTASLYLAQNPTNLQPRFDVVEVFCHDNEIKSVKHLENAFTLL